MKEVEIPEGHTKALVEYLGLPAEKKTAFLETLNQAKVGLSKKALFDQINNKFGADLSLISMLIDAVISMHITSEYYEGNGFINSIAEEIHRKDSTIEVKSAIPELERILNTNKALIISAKGEYLALNREKVLVETRLFSDIRPIFIDNGNEDIQASILMYTLKLTYYQSDSSVTEYLAIDESDLEKLKKQIERAQQKQASIAKKMEKSQIKVIKY